MTFAVNIFAAAAASLLFNLPYSGSAAGGSTTIDMRGFKNLSSAMSSPATVGKTVLITAVERCNTLTIPENRGIRIMNRGGISNAGTLTVKGKFSAENRQVFFGTGSIRFEKSAVAEVPAEWWWRGSGEIGSAINSALASFEGITTISGSYPVDPGVTPVRIRSGTTLDGRGNTLFRTGANITGRMIENFHYGTDGDSGFTIRNLRLTGTGDTAGVSDQGAAIGLYVVDSVVLDTIETGNTNGDGIMWRSGRNITARNLTIGSFGRNGFSPTSGSGTIEKVAVTGKPLPGANPGAAIDVENDSATEGSSYTWADVAASDITFVDFYTPEGGDFAHRATFSNCRFGPGFKAMRLLSTQNTTARSFSLDGTTTLKGTGLMSPALSIENVNGVSIDRTVLDVAGSTGVSPGILIGNTVSNLRITNPVFVGGSFSLLVFDTARLHHATLSGGDWGNLYLSGSDNTVTGCRIGTLTLAGADTSRNLFDQSTTIGAVTTVGGALVENNFFPTSGQRAQ